MQHSYRPADPIEAEIDALGGAVLADSGFENEETEPDFDDFTEGEEE